MFQCNCPHEVRSGCSEPKCPHYQPEQLAQKIAYSGHQQQVPIFERPFMSRLDLEAAIDQALATARAGAEAERDKLKKMLVAEMEDHDEELASRAADEREQCAKLMDERAAGWTAEQKPHHTNCDRCNAAKERAIEAKAAAVAIRART